MERENLFRINLDDENSTVDHEELILRRVSAETAKKEKALNERLVSAFSKGVGKQLWLFFLPLGFLLAALVFLARVIAVFSEAKTLALPAALVSLVLFFAAGVSYAIYRKHKNDGDETFDKTLSSLSEDFGDYHTIVKKELCVPDTAKFIEVFTRMYSNDSSDDDEAYTNDTVEVFAEGENLCFLYGDVILAVPLSSIEAVVKVGERITFDSWNKEIRHDKGDFLQYKIAYHESKDGDETYSMEGYYAVRFVHRDTPFEILIPLYDIAPVLEILQREPIEE